MTLDLLVQDIQRMAYRISNVHRAKAQASSFYSGSDARLRLPRALIMPKGFLSISIFPIHCLGVLTTLTFSLLLLLIVTGSLAFTPAAQRPSLLLHACILRQRSLLYCLCPLYPVHHLYTLDQSSCYFCRSSAILAFVPSPILRPHVTMPFGIT